MDTFAAYIEIDPTDVDTLVVANAAIAAGLSIHFDVTDAHAYYLMVAGDAVAHDKFMAATGFTLDAPSHRYEI